VKKVEMWVKEIGRRVRKKKGGRKRWERRWEKGVGEVWSVEWAECVKSIINDGWRAKPWCHQPVCGVCEECGMVSTLLPRGT
jgi:hypothetical protein